jgi:hypothetical protein
MAEFMASAGSLQENESRKIQLFHSPAARTHGKYGENLTSLSMSHKSTFLAIPGI